MQISCSSVNFGQWQWVESVPGERWRGIMKRLSQEQMKWATTFFLCISTDSFDDFEGKLLLKNVEYPFRARPLSCAVSPSPLSQCATVWGNRRGWGGEASNGVQNGPIVAENYHKNRANSVRDFKKSTKDENQKEMRKRWETEASWLGSLLLLLLVVVAAQQLFNIPVIRIVIFVVPLRVFDFNTNFTFYNQINWSRCRRITSWTGLSQARDAVETQTERGSQQRGMVRGGGTGYLARGVACHWLHLTLRRLGARETREALLIYANIDTDSERRREAQEHVQGQSLCASQAVKLVPRYLLFCQNFEYFISLDLPNSKPNFHGLPRLSLEINL